MKFYHYFHILKPSIWPLLVSLQIFTCVMTFLNILQGPVKSTDYILLLFVIIWLGFIIFSWFEDITVEGVYNRHHTKQVNKSLRLGAILFIISEIMLFSGFFWSFFHSSLAPSHAIGCVWPPMGIEPIVAYKLPLANTIILLCSGATITLAHHAYILSTKEAKEPVLVFSRFSVNLVSLCFGVTIGLGLLFTSLQITEYIEASFSINSGIYGSVFYMLTGLHGLHVLLGSIMLLNSFLRYLAGHFTVNNHFAFQFAALYWHFVDVVWIILFVVLYTNIPTN